MYLPPRQHEPKHWSPIQKKKESVPDWMLMLFDKLKQSICLWCVSPWKTHHSRVLVRVLQFSRGMDLYWICSSWIHHVSSQQTKGEREKNVYMKKNGVKGEEKSQVLLTYSGVKVIVESLSRDLVLGLLFRFVLWKSDLNFDLRLMLRTLADISLNEEEPLSVCEERMV